MLMDTFKKILCALGRWLLDNCIALIVGTASLALIVQSMRLWLRSFLAQYYELFVFFLVVAFVAGFVIGACKRFAEFYRRYAKEYERRKELEEAEVRYFKRLMQHEKLIIRDAFNNGSTMYEVSSVSEFLEKFDASELAGRYLEIEVIDNERVRLMPNKHAQKFLKKHSFLFDCLK